MISICRDHTGNVKRWQGGTMSLRWCAAGMVEAAKQFRRFNGYLHLSACAPRSKPRSPALSPHIDAQEVESGLMIIGAATEVQRNSGHPLSESLTGSVESRPGPQGPPGMTATGRPGASPPAPQGQSITTAAT
jgi:hypothetical protein